MECRRKEEATDQKAPKDAQVKQEKPPKKKRKRADAETQSDAEAEAASSASGARSLVVSDEQIDRLISQSVREVDETPFRSLGEQGADKRPVPNALAGVTGFDADGVPSANQGTIARNVNDTRTATHGGGARI